MARPRPPISILQSETPEPDARPAGDVADPLPVADPGDPGSALAPVSADAAPGDVAVAGTDPAAEPVQPQPPQPPQELTPQNLQALFPVASDLVAPADPDNPFVGEEPDTQANLRRIHDVPFGYLMGDAGTGKSYLARRYAELCDNGMLIATTGIAAVNIGGTTINSALRYFDTESMQLEYEYGRLGVALKQLAQGGVTRLVVDEVSMMDGNQLDILALALKDVNEERLDKGQDAIGVWLTGDFAQLPPVGVFDKKKDQRAIPPIYAFQSKAWPLWGDNKIHLTKIRRQADEAFIRAIQALRVGDKSCTDYFRQFITKQENPTFTGTTILAKNDEVDRYNNVRMLRIDAQEDVFPATRKYKDPKDQPSEWKNIPEKLVLKPGCLVMILSNRKYLGSTDLMYANGDLGIYQRKINDAFAEVKLIRNGQVVNVASVQRERLKPGTPRTVRRREDIPEEYILASIDYMPLRVAYASTVHKSQGLSLDNVQVMINSQFWMSAGMLYVGLSRARTPQGLTIVGTVDQFAARVRTNPTIKEWV